MSYDEIKSLLREAESQIYYGNYKEADKLVRGIAKYGGTVQDIRANLSPAAIKQMNGWAG